MSVSSQRRAIPWEQPKKKMDPLFLTQLTNSPKKGRQPKYVPHHHHADQEVGPYDQPPPVLHHHDQPPTMFPVDGSTTDAMMTTALKNYNDNIPSATDYARSVTPPPMSSIGYTPPNIKLQHRAAKQRLQQMIINATSLEEARRAFRDANKVRYRCVYCEDYH